MHTPFNGDIDKALPRTAIQVKRRPAETVDDACRGTAEPEPNNLHEGTHKGDDKEDFKASVGLMWSFANSNGLFDGIKVCLHEGRQLNFFAQRPASKQDSSNVSEDGPINLVNSTALKREESECSD